MVTQKDTLPSGHELEFVAADAHDLLPWMLTCSSNVLTSLEIHGWIHSPWQLEVSTLTQISVRGTPSFPFETAIMLPLEPLDLESILTSYGTYRKKSDSESYSTKTDY